jgi:hypothetical protein
MRHLAGGGGGFFMSISRLTISTVAALALLVGQAAAQAGGSAGDSASGTPATGPVEGSAGKDAHAAKSTKKIKTKKSKGTTHAKGRSGTDSSFKGDSQGQTSGAAGVSPGTSSSTHPHGSAAEVGGGGPSSPQDPGTADSNGHAGGTER